MPNTAGSKTTSPSAPSASMASTTRRSEVSSASTLATFVARISDGLRRACSSSGVVKCFTSTSVPMRRMLSTRNSVGMSRKPRMLAKVTSRQGKVCSSVLCTRPCSVSHVGFPTPIGVSLKWLRAAVPSIGRPAEASSPAASSANAPTSATLW